MKTATTAAATREDRIYSAGLQWLNAHPKEAALLSSLADDKLDGLYNRLLALTERLAA